MNILFLTLSFSRERGLYTDLVKELSSRGHEIYVVTPIERRYKKNTRMFNLDNIKILEIRTGNLQKVNKIEKGISTILFEKSIINGIKKYISNVKFDLVLYSTPPITLYNVIKYVKKRDGCIAYLMLKDIFPQNAVDLGMFRKKSLLHKFFRKKEVKLYNISDYIGCMSEGNKEYILSNNIYLNKEKVELLPNTITPISIDFISDNKKYTIRKKYGIPENRTVFVYGGNLGKPQGIDFLIECILKNEERNDTFFLIIGSGTEYLKLSNFIEKNNIVNSKLYSYVEKCDYDILLKVCDVGLVFLDSRFTIPNIPSRILSYMENAIPIIASTDTNTDLKDIMEEGKFGLWSRSGDLERFFLNIDKLSQNIELRKLFGMNGRIYLEKNYTSRIAVDIILDRFEEDRSC